MCSKYFVCILMVLGLFISCQEKYSNDIFGQPEAGFKEYKIPKGEAYSTDSTRIITLNGITEMKFKFRFDNSAVYTTKDPSNQADINKLYGFADCVSFTTQYTIAPHHINSARFGWSWYNQALRIYAYYYNDSVRFYKELRTVDIGKSYTGGIKLVPGGYEFSIDNKKDTVIRKCAMPTISGYKLFPYFGGTETAPHTITISLKEL